MRLGIVASRFNEALPPSAPAARASEAHKLGIEASTVITVPGALEIPLALQWLAQTGEFDALVAVGA